MDTRQHKRGATSERKRRSSAQNGKLGGRPKNLVVVVKGGKSDPLPSVVVDEEVRVCSPPVDLGAGNWMFQELTSGKQWVLPMEIGSAPDGSYVARYVPKGKTPFQVAKESQVRAARVPGKAPLFGCMSNGYGQKAFYPAEFHGPDPLQVMRRLQDEWNRRGKKTWEILGWPIEKEKATQDGRTKQIELVNRIELELGPVWGEVLRSWVARGRVFPHPWGDGARAWIRARRKQEAERLDPLEGFEV